MIPNSNDGLLCLTQYTM